MQKHDKFFDGIEWRLIVNYFAGECSEEEHTVVETWITSNPSRKEKIEAFRKIWDKRENLNLSEQTNSAWNEVNERINKPAYEKHPSKKFGFQPFALRLMKVAAVLSILIGGYFIAVQTGILNQKQVIVSWNEKTTASGEKSIVTLLDGTKITLNADSKLKYPVRFDGNTREVYLEGEAYFEVQHDSTKPFIVHADGISTTVLGTKFNICAFGNEKNIIVSLVEGKVKVSKHEGNVDQGIVVLQPEQQVVYNKTNDISSFGDFDYQEAVGWKDNVLVFKKEPFKNVLVKLERTYGIKFELTDQSFNNKKITANFNNESIWTISESLKKLTGLSYKTFKEKNELKKIVFYKK